MIVCMDDCLDEWVYGADRYGGIAPACAPCLTNPFNNLKKQGEEKLGLEQLKVLLKSVSPLIILPGL